MAASMTARGPLRLDSNRPARWPSRLRRRGGIMANRHRGEIEAVLDGKSYRLCLTLGALAELEHAFGEDDMLAVAERFEAGRIAARDAIRMIGAGLRGAGYEIGDDAVAAMRAENGA